MIIEPYLHIREPSDVVPSYIKDLKMEQKTKVAQNCGFFPRFLFLAHFDHQKPKYCLHTPVPDGFVI